MNIEIVIKINASIENVWTAWNNPSDIVQWNFASNDWTCSSASNELVIGGKFNYRMQAKDSSMGFDFEGAYTSVLHHAEIEYELADGRKINITFIEIGNGVKIIKRFDADNKHTAEQQKQGWQSILTNFKHYVEGKLS